MKKYTSIILSILFLAGVVIGTTFWLVTFYPAAKEYRSPLYDIDLAPIPSPTASTNNVVIVLVSGLGYDTSLVLDLPVFEQLKQVGVNAAVESVPPTFSQTAWATLITGAPPETNDAPPIDLLTEDLRLLQVDTLFTRAHAAQMKTALLGHANWRRLIPRNQLDTVFFVEESGIEGDQTIMETALAVIENDTPDLLLIHLSQLNTMGQNEGGPGSPAYQEAANRVDAYLAQISAALDLKNTTLVIVSEHGQIGSGGYGGPEPDVIWQPFVMVGGGTVPGIYSDIHQTDIAPTLATLLGVSAPGIAQGRILFEMLRLDEKARAATQLALAAQRTTLAEAYVRQIQDESAGLPGNVTQDLTQAQAALDNENIGGAYELALLAQREADAVMSAVRHSQIRQEQWTRLIFTAAIVAVLLVMVWRRRGLHAGSVLIVAVITVVLYHALYQLQGNSYTLSSLNAIGLDNLPFEIARRVAVSLLAGSGLMLIFFMLTDEENWATLLGTSYGFSVLVTFAFIMPFFWGYWQNGWLVTWRLPDIEAIFWQVSGAIESLWAAALGLVLPWPIMILSLIINLTRRRFSATPVQESSQPESQPGLRL